MPSRGPRPTEAGRDSSASGDLNQEASAFDVSVGAFMVGIGMCGPTLIAHGTEEQKQRYLAAMLRGEEVWCQLFSEPRPAQTWQDSGHRRCSMATSS